VPPPEDRTLELTGEALRRLIDAAAARVVAHVDSLPKQPSADVEGGAALARSLAEPLPETGTPAEQLLELLFERVIPRSFNTAGPGYLAYIPGGGLPQSAVADLVSNATNRYVGVFAAAPGLAQLESNVVRWFCDLAGLPASARGILTSGGSLATFSALVAARRDRLPDDFLSGTIYVSDQTHHAVQKAAILAGFPEDRVRSRRRSRPIAPRGGRRFSWSATPARRTPAPSTICPRSRTSPHGSGSGSTSTPRTAGSSS
jgi:aromatic-L-amino-acid decarboxylase